MYLSKWGIKLNNIDVLVLEENKIEMEART